MKRSPLEIRLLTYMARILFRRRPRPSDQALILDPQATREAAAMIEASPDLTGDRRTLTAAGQLHFFRFTATKKDSEDNGDMKDADHLQSASMFFGPLLAIRPRAIPRPLREFLVTLRDEPPDPGANRASSMLRAALRSEGPWTDVWRELGRHLIVQDDDDEAVAVLRHSAPADEPGERPARDSGYAKGMANRAIDLLLEYRQTGRIALLDEARVLLREAVADIPDDDLDYYAYVLPALASAVHELFDEFGDQDALQDALAIHRRAVAKVPTDHQRYGGLVANLGGCLAVCAIVGGDSAMLDEAIDLLLSTRPESSEEFVVANNLAIALRHRHLRTREMYDLERALAEARSAVRLAATTAERRAALHVHAQLLMARVEVNGLSPTSGRDLREALRHLRAAVDLCSDDDPVIASSLFNLGMALLMAREMGDPRAADEAAAAFRRVAAHPLAAPRNRARAAINAGRLAADAADWESAVEQFVIAISQLEQAVPRGLGRSDQERQLRDLRGLAADAAACALRAGAPGQAAVLLEQGRGVLLAQAMDTRPDVRLLESVPRELAERFHRLRESIERVGSGPLPGASPDMMTTTEFRRRLLARWDQLMTEIRAVAGLKDFLRPPSIEDLTRAAAEGAIVLVNSSTYGSDAIVVQENGVTSVPLPLLSPHTARVMAAELHACLGSRHPNERLTALLGELWDAVAGPVLHHLGVVEQLRGDASDQRIWWCPSGFLSFLPLHAAGYHETRNDRHPRTVIDRVISSYAPTIRTLRHARGPAPSDDEAGSMLVVAMPQTPGQSSLSGAADEAEILSELLDGVTVLQNEQATRAAVTAALGEHRRVHFACHAMSDLDNPWAGHLLLHDGALAVAEAVALRHERAELAVLSACSTFQSGLDLADEVIHLGSAFQLAGYRQVIATLWEVPDLTAVDLTAETHRRIAGEDGLAGTANAVNRAIRELRDLVPESPVAWAAHVHSGP
ncbi:CHAT domain-containing protein [Streptosporangiaceae bacterium NEAU-GS5]|nr:CHAT domain-containing protein [Streptosporangiaceae bacterium NEAU-GS5]